MKKLILLAASAALISISCEKQEQAVHQEDGMGYMTVTAAEAGLTKAGQYTDQLTFETSLKSVQVLVFNEDDELENHLDLGTSVTSGKIRSKIGKKTVWVVANGPDLSGVKKPADVEQTVVSLSDHNRTDGFVMAGMGSCSVLNETTSSVTVTISRLVARVALISIKNSLPAVLGDLKVERVFLANVVGNQNIAGTASPGLWYNKEGRCDEDPRQSLHIIDGSAYKASLPDLTYAEVGQTIANGSEFTPSSPYLFYSFANSSASTPNGFSSTFGAQRSVLVVAATVSGKLQYYPVILSNGLERNTASTVSLTILGFGGDDPNRKVMKGNFDTTIKISAWSAIPAYDETI